MKIIKEEEYEFEDAEIIKSIGYESYVNLVVEQGIVEVNIYKEDVVALARYFNLTAEEIK